MKRFGLILTTIGLFSLSVYLAFVQGNVSMIETQNLGGTLTSIQASPLVYAGFKAEVAKIFIVIMNSLLVVTGKSILIAIIALGLLVELVLLYPSLRIQMKQKKIHLFHKKLVDRFSKGELSVSKTEDELHKLYDVNEKMHHRGAVMVAIQMALLFFTFWGLSLMAKAPDLLDGSWNVLNFSLLSKPMSYWVPLLAGIMYLFHATVKIYYKEKEDYISPAQTTIAVLFAIIGSVIVYLFAGAFAVALTVYFITLIAFGTIRYIIVEQHAKEWGKFAQRELIKMLKEAGPHHDKFEYFSRMWNHIPIVRHINFNLLEESLSMTLGLILALTFFGAFVEDGQELRAYIQHKSPAKMVVEVTQID